MARSGHTSVRSLAKYARVSAEALGLPPGRARPSAETIGACDEDWCRILSHLVRSGRSPMIGARLVVR
jgi:hypothetical protein